MTNSDNANVLVHHGILGQKWGVRRFQNKDGSLTGAGKKRYSTEESRMKFKDGVKKVGKTAAVATAAVGSAVYAAQQAKASSGKTKVSDMSDEELINANKRAALEKTYSKNNPEYNPNETRNAIDKTTRDALELEKAINGKASAKARAEENARLTNEAKTMSDQELREFINRANLEQQYVRLNQSDVDAGRNQVRETLQTIGAAAGIAATLTPVAIKIGEEVMKRKG